MTDLFRGIRNKIDFRTNARKKYETRVASKSRILDIGGRNFSSRSRRDLDSLSKNPDRSIVCTDILSQYGPDIVDDICNTSIRPHSFDGVYCNAILEHVEEYWKAVDNIHDVLKEGGEAFFYVPFMYHFHDFMDYHRFTFTEVARMLKNFSSVRIFIPGEEDGFGWVFWYVVTMTAIARFKRLHNALSRMTDSIVRVFLRTAYVVKRQAIQKKYGQVSLDEFCFYYLRLFMNHGFCAWAKK